MNIPPQMTRVWTGAFPLTTMFCGAKVQWLSFFIHHSLLVECAVRLSAFSLTGPGGRGRAGLRALQPGLTLRPCVPGVFIRLAPRISIDSIDVTVCDDENSLGLRHPVDHSLLLAQPMSRYVAVQDQSGNGGTKDPQGETQGPCPAQKMLKWMEQGYFSPDTQVRPPLPGHRPCQRL